MLAVSPLLSPLQWLSPTYTYQAFHSGGAERHRLTLIRPPESRVRTYLVTSYVDALVVKARPPLPLLAALRSAR